MSKESSIRTEGPPPRTKEARNATQGAQPMLIFATGSLLGGEEWDELGPDEAEVGRALLGALPQFSEFPDLMVTAGFGVKTSP